MERTLANVTPPLPPSMRFQSVDAAMTMIGGDIKVRRMD